MHRSFSYSITEESAGTTIERYLRRLGYSRHILSHLKRSQTGILCNGVHACTPQQLHCGDLLSIHIEEECISEKILPRPVPFSIVYEDEDLLVVNKPADTPIHPSQGNYENTLANGVALYYEQQNLPFVYRCINRLDRNTTGLLILAKNMLSGAILSQMMRNREIHRTYQALVWGKTAPADTISLPIGRKEGSSIERIVDLENGEYACTHYRTLQYFSEYSLVELQLETGRTHQIRVHMTASGYPLLGDSLYNPSGKPLILRQALHSCRLEFAHPITKEALCFFAELPEDMQRLIKV